MSLKVQHLEYIASSLSGMTGDHVEEVVDLVFVVHPHLGLALVALHRVELLIRVHHCRRLLPPFLLEREPELLVGDDGAVNDKHGPVLGLVDGVPLAVQAHHGEAGWAVQHCVTIWQGGNTYTRLNKLHLP